ncbi:TPA: helix-turn-helix transcriptional regulator [Stenotrophomonas maltophilia]|uniref:Helix-turn-helix transcriptional regulator n=1 Tax=Stenotrophomonas maltophilia TaxID=40324 RepID=A0AAI9BZ72_STEMA|nr:helix-turn-helix transcriptional regulator [Stenotrophomonas maltophilia]HEL5042621.1 helix-turn-helix transcriptional regulator [Stenotrophomonas maltophilia]
MNSPAASHPSPAALKLTPTQLAAMASPTRMAILQRLDAEGPASIRELAERLGRPATALYHHLAHLEKHGLVRITEHRDTGRRPEAVYAAAAAQLSSRDAVRTPSGRRSLVHVATRVVAATLRAFASAATHAAARFEGPHRNCVVRHLSFRADDARLARINALIDELEATGLDAGTQGDTMLLTVLMAPATHKPRGTPT